MSNPLHARFYADRVIHEQVTVEENVPIAESTWRVRFRCPSLARRILPGQFLMLKLSGQDDPLIGRPLALYDVVCGAAGEPECVDVVYLVHGNLTTRLAHCTPGDSLDVWGPLGNGFQAEATRHLVMVVGGIGQTPMLALGKWLLGRQEYGENQDQPPRCERVTLCYGARRASLLAGLEDFSAAGFQVTVATDDGSQGTRGLVTDLLAEVLDSEPDLGREQVQVVCCGPEAMMAAVSKMTAERSVRCQVSLETPMACGIGICFSCVARVKDGDGNWDFKRTCVEGPVFDAELIDWGEVTA